MELSSLWISTFGAVFAIVDPFGYVPIFLAMTASDSDERRQQMLLRACVAAFLVLGIFTLFGKYILDFFGISIPALQISGGIILLAIGFEMLRVLRVHEKLSQAEETEATHKEDISIIPLAIPMLSGPASIATVVILSSKAGGWPGSLLVVLSILLTLVITYWILRYAKVLLRVVGHTGLNVATRIMGLILCAMAIQYLIDGFLTVTRS